MRRDEGMPRWFKVGGLVALVLLLAVVVLLLAGVGDHGPGRHAATPVQSVQLR